MPGGGWLDEGRLDGGLETTGLRELTWDGFGAAADGGVMVTGGETFCGGGVNVRSGFAGVAVPEP